PQLWNRRIEMLDVRQTAAEHDDVRIEKVDDACQRAGKPILVALEDVRGGSPPPVRGIDDGGRVVRSSPAPAVVFDEGGARQKRFNAAAAAAIAATAPQL